MDGVARTIGGARGYAGAHEALANWIAGAAAAALVDVYTNDVSPEGASVLSDFEFAAYTGYAQGTVTTWGAVHRSGNDASSIAENVITFVGPADGGGPLVYGFVLHKMVGPDDTLIAAFRFESPLSLQDDAEAVAVVPTLTVKASDA